MKKILFILFTVLAIVGTVNAQSISRKTVSTAGGSLTAGNNQLTFTIGETMIPSLSAASALITQGFQQPGESIKTGSVSATVCAGSSFNLPYTATDIGGGNSFTAQLSNAAGSFASPVTIGTLAGNASTGTINVTIPANTAAGNGYRIRITSSSPAYTGTNNGANITIQSAPIASISYGGSSFCRTGNIDVTRTGQSGGTYSATPAGLSINSSNGKINLGASAANTYTVTYSFTNGSCPNTAIAMVTVNAIPVVPVVAAQSFCGSATVASLPSGGGMYRWYLASSGGSALSASTALSTRTYYVSNATANCESVRAAVSVTVNTLVTPSVASQLFCGAATVASLPSPNGTYKWYLAATGGTALISTTPLTTATYYVSRVSGNCESTRVAVSVTVIIVNKPVVADLTYCIPVVVALLPNGGGTYKWYKKASGGSALSPITVVTTGDYYVSSSSGACESERTKVRITIGFNATAGTINGSAQICEGATAAYTSNGTAGGSWSSSKTSVATVNATTGLVTAVDKGKTTIKYTVNTGCGNSVTASKEIEVKESPTASISYGNTVFCKSGSVNVSRSGQSGGTYSATPSGLSINSSSGKVNLANSSTGTYTVSYSFSNGSCSAIATTTLKINNCNNNNAKVIVSDSVKEEPTAELAVKFDVMVYPNPTNHQFTFTVQSESNEAIDVVVYDVLGRMLKHIQKTDGKTIVLGEDLPAGVYIAVVNQGSYKKSINLIKK